MNTEFPRPTTTGARRAAAAYRTCSGCSTRSCPRGSCIGTCSSLSSLPLFWSLFNPLSPRILICSSTQAASWRVQPQSWMWPKFIKNPGAGGRVTSTHGFQREANESILGNTGIKTATRRLREVQHQNTATPRRDGDANDHDEELEGTHPRRRAGLPRASRPRGKVAGARSHLWRRSSRYSEPWHSPRCHLLQRAHR